MVRILLADDHEVVRSGLKQILECQAGWSVVGEAATGSQAVSMALELKPDVAVVDYVLPLLNGVEVTRQIRTRIPRAEVLMFAAQETDDLVGAVLQAGARAFVTKSEGKDQIIAAVRALAAHKPFLAGDWSQRLLEGFLDKLSKNGSVLTPRERMIVQLIAEGHGNREMGQILNLSVKTIETHRSSALQKLHIKTTAGLVRYAIRNQLVEA